MLAGISSGSFEESMWPIVELSGKIQNEQIFVS